MNPLPGPGLYVHFPWCVKKCPYCDFNSHPLAGDFQGSIGVGPVADGLSLRHRPLGAPGRAKGFDENGYVEALTGDFAANAGELRFATAFLGGGTPSLFSAAAIRTLLDKVRPRLAEDAEITMEANPGAVEHEAFGAYRQAGVNRLSIGAQSFSAAMLARLGRIHGPDETERALAEARAGGFDNINLDLMYGLPEQSPDDALADLERAVALEPDHLSWYQLTIEPKTAFARHPPPTPDEDAIAAMEAAGRALLANAGYRRYEISAYARPGAECRHNLVYWTFGDYLGIGAGAAGKRRRGGATVRTSKPRQPRLYLENPGAMSQAPVSNRELPGEFMMNALRLVEGVERQAFTDRCGLPWSAVAPIWKRTTALGLTEPNRIRATALGLRHLDRLVQFFL